MAIKALIPDGPLRAYLEPLPAGVTLTDEADADVEFMLLTIDLVPRAAELPRRCRAWRSSRASSPASTGSCR